MLLPHRDMLQDEIDNLKLLRHAPSVVHFQDFFEEKTTCFVVLELMRGGELFEKLIEKSIFTEDEAQDACRCVLSALDYMHDKRVVHRDLKPENLMLAVSTVHTIKSEGVGAKFLQISCAYAVIIFISILQNDDLRSVKLCDFGFSKMVESKNALRTRCGTPGFTAPEILERWPSYDVKCDVWSFGVIMFFLLGGENPFDPPGATEKECIELTNNGRFYFRPSQWKDLSFECKDLVVCCLKTSPNRRIDAKSALKHDWLQPKKPARRNSRISAVALKVSVMEMRKAKREGKVNKKERVNNLNAEFDEYLQNRKGDSLVSLMANGSSTQKGSIPGGGRRGSINMTFEEDSPSGRPFSDFYIAEQELGKGAFAIVLRCTHTRTGQRFAVKEVSGEKMNNHQKEMLKAEINVMKFLRGAPHVLRLFDVFEEPGKTFMVIEEMKGGALLDRVIEKTVYTEREAQDLGKYLLEAVKYCHSKNIAHRDIKLENLLMVVSAS
jgi:serine/threonine protein kinase